MTTSYSRLARQSAAVWCFILLLTTIAQAQLFEKSDNQMSRKDQIQALSQQSLQNTKGAIMDGTIDPKEYTVGPGDIYSANIWVSPPVNFQLPVTPEGTVIIPTVGEISIAGMHLDVAKKKVIAALKKSYISGDVSFTLLVPRMFQVKVVGAGIINEVSINVQATERAENALVTARDQMNLALKDTRLSGDDYRVLSQVGSTRKILLHHKDGTQSTADIDKYNATKDPRFDPLLRDGDVIIMPERNLTKDFVSVYGGVNGKGAYEFVGGDSLLSMIRIAHDFSPLADTGRVEVLRSDSLDNTLQTISFDARDIIAGRTPDYALHRGDRIIVKEKKELRRDSKVQIEGEVLYPGYYPITKDSTKLTDLVRMAGGFTEFASLSISKVFRRSITEREIVSERLESARGGVTPEDSAYFYLETNVRLNRELVVVDFVSLFSRNDNSKDVYVIDGDDIVIGSQKKTIYVFGQVVNPGHVLYVAGQKYDFYVNQAGGFTAYAREGDVRVIKANTKQWLKPSETSIEEGDYVWVPKEPYRPFGYYIQVYSQVFGILGTIATLAVLVVQLRK